jgi:hypothetical protein
MGYHAKWTNEIHDEYKTLKAQNARDLRKHLIIM